jgi:hypothetical protein
MTIHANGTMIGAVSEWSPEHSLDIAAVYEFGQVTGPYGHEFGAPYEKVPQNISGQTISISRYDIYTAQMESVFGTVDLQMLSSDPGMANGGTGHLDLRETWHTPGGTNNYSILYQGCWFSRIGRTMSASGDRIINVGATVEWTQRRRVK